MNKGEQDKAINQYQQALVIQKKVQGPKHENIASYQNNLDLAQHAKGDLDQALSQGEKANEIFIEVHGANHPLVAASQNNLGGTAKKSGD